MAQPDERLVNMYDGHCNSSIGCVLMHFAKAHKIDVEAVAFAAIGKEPLERAAAVLLIRISPELPSQTENYGILKRRIYTHEAGIFAQHPSSSKGFTIFNYDGSMAGVEEPYTANFNQWSSDPGIAIMECSDGQIRLIPASAIKDFDHEVMMSFRPTS